MSNNTPDKYIEKFRGLFQNFEQHLNGQKVHPIHELRRAAISRLEEMRFPTRRDEDYKYTNFNSLLAEDYRSAASEELALSEAEPYFLKEVEAFRLTFVNGNWNPDLSTLAGLPDGVVVSNLQNALDHPEHQKKVQHFLGTTMEESGNSFKVLNTAFGKGGAFIYVPSNVVVDRPIHLLYINTTESGAFAQHPQVLVFLEKSAQLRLVESHYGRKVQDGAYFSNVLNHFELSQNAHLQHVKFQLETSNAYQVNNTTVLQERDSVYTNFSLDLGGKLVRNNLSAIHRGENVLTNFYGGILAKGDQHIDNQTFIDHAIPNCQSNELYKTILDDNAKGVFNGKVMVRKDAQKTNAFQQNSSLVLSETALMNSKPQLEIFADDVRCSHGATIGQLDEGSMFYLKSRGIKEKQAREMLQMAFLLEVLDNIPMDGLRPLAEELSQQKFEE